ncbi:type V secretion protein A [Serratia sp. S1B]|nr:type V secretion protein A [Serratia sp. S1B]
MVSSSAESGIYAGNNYLGTDMYIQAFDVVGGKIGIDAKNYGFGVTSVIATGTVTGISDTGIYAFSGGGTKIIVQAVNVLGGQHGIQISKQTPGTVSVSTTGTVTGTTGYGIYAPLYYTADLMTVTVSDSSIVQGGTAAIYLDAMFNTSAMQFDINNSGTIRNLSGLSSDLAIQTVDSNIQTTITNQGIIQGTVQLTDVGNRFINNVGATWDTAGGTNDFGAGVDSNSLVNNGTVITANGSATDSVQVTTFNNVGTFSNASGGILSMVNDRAGDVTVINGNYVGDGGTVQFDSVLAGDNSVSDKLVINGDTSGITYVSVNNLGGIGAATLNGIELIEVNGLSEGEFTGKGRIVAGAYDYSLVRGVNTHASNWYLTSKTTPVDPVDPVDPIRRVDPVDPIDPIDPVGPVEPVDPVGPVEPMRLRPEAGAYSANLAAANNLFVIGLHDRLGETQYIDALTGEQKVTSMWLRTAGGHNRSRDESGQLRTQANRYVMQLGGDIAQWSHNSQDRFHLGLMVGYGNSQSNTVSGVSGYDAKGKVDGYSLGAYATWYANAADKSGLYVDSWMQYSWFDNAVTGQGLATEKYHSKGVTASVESGYAFKLGENATKNLGYFIQPKAQIIWMGVKANDHQETNGSKVSGEGDGNIQTRLGVKAFMTGHSEQDKARMIQPFVEANWVHNSKDFGSNMNGISAKQDGAANIAELKVGVEGQINQQLNLWGNVGQQVGNNGYSDTAVMLGAKYRF